MTLEPRLAFACDRRKTQRRSTSVAPSVEDAEGAFLRGFFARHSDRIIEHLEDGVRLRTHRESGRAPQVRAEVVPN
jgi:hypothetical protein